MKGASLRPGQGYTGLLVKMNRDLIIDCFAGGGGASVGIEMALGRPVDIAINHDPDRIPGKVTGGMREDDGDQPVLVFKTPDRCKKEDGGSIDQNKRKESGDGEINGNVWWNDSSSKSMHIR